MWSIEIESKRIREIVDNILGWLWERAYIGELVCGVGLCWFDISSDNINGCAGYSYKHDGGTNYEFLEVDIVVPALIREPPVKEGVVKEGNAIVAFQWLENILRIEICVYPE